MKNILLGLCLSLVAGTFAIGQITTSTDDYKKGEGYVGYSNGQIDTGLGQDEDFGDLFKNRESFNGVNVSGVYNFTRYVGVKGDVSATYNSKSFQGTFANGGLPYNVSLKTNNSLYNFLGGVQVKDNAKSGRFKPFAHALAGVAHARSKISDYTCSPSTVCPVTSFPNDTFSESGFAGALGGGIDIRVSDRFQIRAIQVDYNPVWIGGSTQNNIRIGAGIVF